MLIILILKILFHLPYLKKAKNFFNTLLIFYCKGVLENQNLREGIKKFSEWPTIPQLYINKEFIGGCDIIKCFCFYCFG